MPYKRLNYLFQYTPFPELQFNIIQNNLIIQHNCLKRPPCSHRTYKRSPTMGKHPTTNRVQCTVYTCYDGHMVNNNDSHGSPTEQNIQLQPVRPACFNNSLYTGCLRNDRKSYCNCVYLYLEGCVICTKYLR